MSYDFISPKGSFLDRILEGYQIKDRLHEILSTDFKIDLTQPALLIMKEAIEALQDKNVLIIGDFDCDGICATTILKKTLDHLGIRNNYYIPSRTKEGYGLSLAHVQKAIDFHFDVLFMVDNGIVAHDALRMAKKAGILTYIIDHHEYETLPEADVILHGRLLDEAYHKSCASGLCYLVSKCFMEDEMLLAYAGIATLADMVEVFGFNRYLIKEARHILNKGQIHPINALSGKKKDYRFEDLQFQVISKINAVSRMDPRTNVNMMVRFLLEDEIACRKTADQIKQINQLRKDLSDAMYEDAIQKVKGDPIEIIFDPHYLEGLCGLVASKLSRNIGRPCIVLAKGKEGLKGSGRSVGDFDLLSHLLKVEHLFDKVGGHKQAVGVSLKEEHLPDLVCALMENIDIEEEKKVCIALSKEELNLETLSVLERLEPFGTGLEEPLFYLEDVQIEKCFLIKKMYPKFTLDNGVEAISFNKNDYRKEFQYMIGYLHGDSYRKNRISFQIQELF